MAISPIFVPQSKTFLGILFFLSGVCGFSPVQAGLESSDLPGLKMMTFWNDWVEENILSSLRVGEESYKSKCFTEIEQIFTEGGEKRNTIIDATGKPSSGILQGNVAWLGDFRQCMDATDLHYCLLKLPIHAEAFSRRVSGSLSLGVCVPEECSGKDINDAIKFIDILLFNGTKNLMIHCSDRLNPLSDSGFICTIVFLSLLCALCLGATAYESYRHHYTNISDEESIPILQRQSSCNSNEHSLRKTEIDDSKDLSTWRRCFLCFSLSRSINQITSTISAKDDIVCLHGMRVISMFWIIMGHSFSFQQKSQALADILWVYTGPAKWFTSQVIYSAYVALDTFFFLGGLLVAYTGFKYMAKSVGRVNWLIAIVHRYLRITPAMAVMILLYTFVYPYLGEGPFWHLRVQDTLACYDWWWTNFLYINNFVPSNTSSGCLSWSWYLATDMQLFLLSIILIVLIWWFPVIGIFVLCLLTVTSIIIRAVLFSVREYQATQFANALVGHHGDMSMFIFSVKPYANATPYLIGIAMGYILHILKNKRVPRLHVIIVVLGWLTSFAIGMSLVYGLYSIFDHPGMELVPLDKTLNVLYGSIGKLAWTLAMSWVVFSCHHGYGGVINRFLSWRLWIPLSRLTFCAYLLHPAIIYLFTGTVTTSYNVTVIDQSFLFAGFVTISYSAASILSSLIEMPIGSLQKMFLKR
ncbi:nose resistant to fluoxetine protein 6-like [Lytechinus pictus]|uniref:nose resistant to fluoxetine protein 6-like n=1 Tax=Lytechinus pictus TaxID=7653 RepID=UPI0030B9C6E5